MRRTRAAAFLVALSTLAAARPDRFLGRTYPLEVAVSFPAGLYHWVDSLAGRSGGKTIEAYRREYLDRFGSVTPEDRAFIEDFVAARAAHVRGLRDRTVPPRDGTVQSALLGIFCGAPTVEEALAIAGRELPDAEAAALRRALEHFRPRYERIWSDGRIPTGFVDRASRDPRRRDLARLLDRIADFYGVEPADDPPPRVVLVPVPDGYGTHAEAIGRFLLVEIREGETLAEQAEVLVHENAHFLYARIPEARREALLAAASASGDVGRKAWAILHEALPTALGQGVAGREFQSGTWSPDRSWYHLGDVDRYAKAIHPLVSEALASGRRFDEGFVRDAIRLLPPVDSEAAPTPR